VQRPVQVVQKTVVNQGSTDPGAVAWLVLRACVHVPYVMPELTG
jgi:hypothetical protein